MIKQLVGSGKSIRLPLVPPDSSQIDEGVALVQGGLFSLLDGSEVATYTNLVPQYGVVEVVLPAQTAPAVLELTLSWSTTSGSVPIVERHRVEVIGSNLISVSDVRGSTKVESIDRYPDSVLAVERDIVEDLFEDFCGVWFRDRVIEIVIPPKSRTPLSPTVYGLAPNLMGSSLVSDRSDTDHVSLDCLELVSSVDEPCSAWIRVYPGTHVDSALRDALVEWVADRAVLGGKKRASRAQTVNTRQGTFDMPDSQSQPSGVPSIDRVLADYQFQGWS